MGSNPAGRAILMRGHSAARESTALMLLARHRGPNVVTVKPDISGGDRMLDGLKVGRQRDEADAAGDQVERAGAAQVEVVDV